MKSRGKDDQENNDKKVPLEELMYRFQVRHQLMMNRAVEHEAEKLGIKPKKSGRRFIEQRNDGVFECNGEPVHFQNKDAEYMWAFIAIFKSQDAGRGYAPYTKINQALEALGAEKINDDEKAIVRIRNRVRDIFRYSDLPKTIPTGEKLIESIAGKGIILRNPVLQ